MIWWIVSILAAGLLVVLGVWFREAIKELFRYWGWTTFLVHWWQNWEGKLSWERARSAWWLWLCCGILSGLGGGIGLASFWQNPLPAKSTFLSLDDRQKWRFSESLRSAALAENGERLSCEFALGLSRPLPQFVWGAWGELQPMLDLAWWRPTPTGSRELNQHQFPPGFTVLAGTDKGPAFICAAALGRVLRETLDRNVPVSVHPNQVTEALTACNNKCVELNIGDFSTR
jgi:hypothetical protein